METAAPVKMVFHEIIKHQAPEMWGNERLDHSFRLMLDNTVGHLEANLGHVDHAHPEAVHQLRVGLRRIRALFHLYRPLLPRSKRLKRFERQLRSYATALGKQRDWDVFLDKTLPILASHTADIRLSERAMEQQHRARNHVSHRLARPHFRRLLSQIRKWSEGVPFPRTTIGDKAPKLLNRVHRQVKKRLHQANRDDQESLHRLRKATKRLRYDVEFVSAFYGPKPVKKYLKSLKAAVDILGDIHDATVTHALLTKIEFADTLRDWTTTHQQHEIAKAPIALRKLKRERFW